MTDTPFTLVQISDLHIKAAGQLTYKVVDTYHALQQVIDQINRMRPAADTVVITGDLTDFGRDDEYRQVRQLLDTLQMPWFAIPGNHDDRQAFYRAFADKSWCPLPAPALNWVSDNFPVRLIGLDSTIPGKPGGRLDSQTLQWLDEILQQAPDRPTMVMLHHPPFVSGIGHMDRQRLENPDDLQKITSRHPQVVRLLCGHVHRYMVSSLGNTLVCTAPGTSHQVAPDFSADGAACFVLEPAGFLVHRWQPLQPLVTHYLPVGIYPGPWPFYDEKGQLID